MAPPGLRIRQGRPEDLGTVVPLLRSMVAELHGDEFLNIIGSALEADATAAVSGEDEDVLLVAEEQEEPHAIVGCGRARIFPWHPMLRFNPSPRHGYIELMMVAPKGRGRSVGDALLHALEDWVRGRGVDWVTLHHSAPARGFYEHAGYSTFAEMVKRLDRPRGG